MIHEGKLNDALNRLFFPHFHLFLDPTRLLCCTSDDFQNRLPIFFYLILNSFLATACTIFMLRVAFLFIYLSIYLSIHLSISFLPSHRSAPVTLHLPALYLLSRSTLYSALMPGAYFSVPSRFRHR